MHAVTYSRFGSVDVLQQSQLDRPSPKKNEILIRVKACEVTKADCELRSLNFPVKWFSGPLRLALGFKKPRKPILGGYLAGEVAEVGSKVTKFKVGDRIFGSSGFQFGGYGEYVCVSQNAKFMLLDNSVEFAQAAGSLLGGLNAIHFLKLAQLKTGEKILINGAGGSIGSFAVQLAKLQGAHVTAVDAGHKLDLLKQLGADECIDYQKTEIAEINSTFDVVFNMVAGIPVASFASKLTPTGRFLTGNPQLKDMYHCWRLNKKTQQRGHFAFAEESFEELAELQKFLADGQLQVPLDGLFQRERIKTAHQRVEQELRIGAVILIHPTTAS